MANTVDYVSTGKPAGVGAIWRAPLGTALPASVDAELDAAYKCLGYCSEDGLTNATDISSEAIKAWGGDTVDTPTTGKTETYKFKAIEALNVDVLKAAYGDSNVSGTAATGITVRHNATDQPECIYVVDMLLRNGGKQRTVIPKAKLTSMGDVVYKDNEATGYDMTFTALSGGFAAGDNDTSKDYKKAASTGSGNV
jgi:hypothetical protein